MCQPCPSIARSDGTCCVPAQQALKSGIGAVTKAAHPTRTSGGGNSDNRIRGVQHRRPMRLDADWYQHAATGPARIGCHAGHTGAEHQYQQDNGAPHHHRAHQRDEQRRLSKSPATTMLLIDPSHSCLSWGKCPVIAARGIDDTQQGALYHRKLLGRNATKQTSATLVRWPLRLPQCDRPSTTLDDLPPPLLTMRTHLQ